MKFHINNYQVKIDSNAVNAITLQKQLVSLLRVMEINHKAKDLPVIYEGLYFDDNNDNFRNSDNKINLRIESRRTSDESKVSILSKYETGAGEGIFSNIVTRKCDQNYEGDIIDKIDDYSKIVKKRCSDKTKDSSFSNLMALFGINCDSIEPNLFIRKESYQIYLKLSDDSKLGDNIVFVEEYSFIDLLSKIESDKFCEIGCQNRSEDPDKLLPEKSKALMTKFFNAVTDILDILPENDSKYVAGRKWLEQMDEETDDFPPVSVFAIDIVGYSKKSSSVQKQQIKFLFNMLLEIIPSVSKKEDYHILPTGDGAFVVFTGDILSALKLAIRFAKRITGFNQSTEFGGGELSSKKIVVRMGMHHGYAFKIKLDRQTNFAGDVINMTQRIMDGGSEGQILSSKEYKKVIIDADDTAKNSFENDYLINIKHDKTFDVSNVYSKDLGFGVPGKPVKAV